MVYVTANIKQFYLIYKLFYTFFKKDLKFLSSSGKPGDLYGPLKTPFVQSRNLGIQPLD